jgi:putative glutamine amidotransferase
MQEIAYYFDNKTIKKLNTTKHFNLDENYVHPIKLKRNGYLNNLLKLNTLNVNSRHNYHIQNNKNYVIEAKCNKVIEAIKVKNTKYILGVQFHPETMKEYDNNAIIILNDFLKQCLNKKSE